MITKAKPKRMNWTKKRRERLGILLTDQVLTVSTQAAMHVLMRDHHFTQETAVIFAHKMLEVIKDAQKHNERATPADSN